MIDVLNLIYIFIFTLLFRSIVRLVYPKLIDFDTYFHLILISHIRKKGTSDLIEEKRFIKPFNMNYPWLAHLILSLLPKKYESFLEKFFNPLLDTLFVIILYCITVYITNSNEKSLTLSLLYVFTPATFSLLGSGPRIKSFTPRLFGEIIGSLVFILEYLYLANNDIIFLYVAIFFAPLVYLSSKFSVQALIFINIFLVILTQHYELLLVIFIGFILAMVYTNGKYFYSLKEQIYHLSWYFRENLKGKMEVSNRNNFKLLVKEILKLNYKKITTILLFGNSFAIVIYKLPILVFYFYHLLNTDKLLVIDLFIISGMIVFFISSLKWFLFIGEAERYFNYLIYLILLSLILNDFSSISLYGLIVYGFIYYIFDLILLIKNQQIKTNKNDTLIQWLNKENNVLNIATIPYHLGNGWRIVCETNDNWLYSMSWADKNEKDFFDNNYILKYPIIDINKAKDIIDYYNLDYIIYDRKVIDKNFDNFKLPDNLKEKKISEDIYAIYK